MLEAFKRVFGCDLRSLALLRVGVALILIFDLINRCTNFYAFHTDAGVLPLIELLQLWGSPWFWSLYYLSTGYWWPTILFILNFLAALSLLVGWKTRYATLVCWILLISLQARMPLILQSGDVLLRLLLFWGFFLPWGTYYSVDSALGKKLKSPPTVLFNWATIAYTLQVIYVYFFTVLLKTGKQWTTDGSAVYLALHIDQFATPFGIWLRQLPLEFLKFLSFSVYYTEWVLPLALLIPWKNGWIRFFLLFGLWMLHLGFGAGLEIGNFVWISIVSTVGLIPNRFWNRYSTPAVSFQGTAYYDQDCNFCLRMVELCKTFFFLPSEIFQPAQSNPEVYALLQKEDSWVFKNENGETFVRAYALREILKESKVFRHFTFLFSIPLVLPIGNQIYKWIAKSRNQICDTKTKPFQADSPYFSLSLDQAVFCFFTLFYITMWNVGTLPRSRIHIAQKHSSFAYLLRVDQKWEMFAPYPLTDDGWYMLKAKLRNGVEIDPLTNEPPTESKPRDVRNTYEDFRWRKYMMNLWTAGYSSFRQPYGRYLCRKWNSSHDFDEQIVTFDIYFIREDTSPPGELSKEPAPVKMSSHHCVGAGP
ncbi:MAG: DCC1-like thiol-disulfide oxidoreductase family protein [Bdellovibrionales bacterium]